LAQKGLGIERYLQGWMARRNRHDVIPGSGGSTTLSVTGKS
jgi:hypothetical protein